MNQICELFLGVLFKLDCTTEPYIKLGAEKPIKDALMCYANKCEVDRKTLPVCQGLIKEAKGKFVATIVDPKDSAKKSLAAAKKNVQAGAQAAQQACMKVDTMASMFSAKLKGYNSVQPTRQQSE